MPAALRLSRPTLAKYFARATFLSAAQTDRLRPVRSQLPILRRPMNSRFSSIPALSSPKSEELAILHLSYLALTLTLCYSRLIGEI